MFDYVRFHDLRPDSMSDGDDSVRVAVRDCRITGVCRTGIDFPAASVQCESWNLRPAQ